MEKAQTQAEITRELLDIANQITEGARRNDYAHPADNFSHTAALWSGFLGVEIKPQWVPMMMMLVKLSREKHCHKDDNIVDMAGYAKTIDICIHELERRKAEKEAADQVRRDAAAVFTCASCKTVKPYDEVQYDAKTGLFVCNVCVSELRRAGSEELARLAQNGTVDLSNEVRNTTQFECPVCKRVLPATAMNPTSPFGEIICTECHALTDKKGSNASSQGETQNGQD